MLGAGIPLFGICFGNQILGRALGRSTYKMVFGHRGINVPVIDHATGRVAVTAQNHGFALEGEAGERFDTPFGAAEVSHTCANDGVVEGIKLVDGRAFSVQYHPEAAAGPARRRVPVRPIRRPDGGGEAVISPAGKRVCTPTRRNSCTKVAARAGTGVQ